MKMKLKVIVSCLSLTILALVLMAAAPPFQPRPLLIDPTNGVPVSPPDFFALNSAAISAVANKTNYDSVVISNSLSVGSITFGGEDGVLSSLDSQFQWAFSDATKNRVDIGTYIYDGERWVYMNPHWMEIQSKIIIYPTEAEITAGKFLVIGGGSRLTNAPIGVDDVMVVGTNQAYYSITNEAAGPRLVGDVTTEDGQGNYTPAYYGWNASGVKTWYPYGSTISLNGASPVTYGAFDYRIGTGLTVSKTAWTPPALGLYFDWAVDTNTIASRVWAASQYVPLAGGQVTGALTFYGVNSGIRMPSSNTAAISDGSIWYGADGRLWWFDAVGGDVARAAMYVGESGSGVGTVTNVGMRAGDLIVMTGETNITSSGTNTVAVETNALATFVQAEIDAAVAGVTNGPNVSWVTNTAGDVYPYIPSDSVQTNINLVGYMRVGTSNNILAAVNGYDWGFFDYEAERLDVGVYIESGQRILQTGTDQTELNGPLLLFDTNLVSGELLKLDGNTVRSAGKTNQMEELQVNTVTITNQISHQLHWNDPVSLDTGTNYYWLDGVYSSQNLNVSNHVTFSLLTNAAPSNVVWYVETTLRNTNASTSYTLTFPEAGHGWYPISAVTTNLTAGTNMNLWFKIWYTNVEYGASR